MRILAAMSGGVDSAVAAARAIDAGHEVVGVHLALSRMPGTFEPVLAVAAQLKIPWTLKEQPMCLVFPTTFGISRSDSK